MRISVLDGHALNPGDLSWDNLEVLGQCAVYDRTRPEEVVPRAADAEVVLTNKTPLRRETLARLPALRYIGVLATGYDVVDVAAARERGVAVTNVPTYGTGSVAQMTFALLLELVNGVGHHAGTVRAGRWSASPDWCYWDHPLVELEGLVLGVVGFGRIGSAVARIARGFGMDVLAATAQAPRAAEGVRFTEIESLLAESDVVTLHCPLTPETDRLMDARRLGLMKETAFLLNTARGRLVDEAALAETLNSGRLAGAGLDVLAVEPPTAANPLPSARNCLVTPHIAWATRAARQRLMDAAVGNVRAFLQGESRNRVD